jgi:PAS domain S-box-containing protein
MDEKKPTDDALNKKRNESGEHGSIEAQAESEDNFRNSMETCPLGIVVMATDGQLFYINQAMLDIAGYRSADDLKDISLEKLYTPESYTAHLERKAKRLKGEKVLTEYEVSIQRRDGEVRTLQVHQQKITLGGACHYMTMYQDITERLKMEATIRYQADLVENIADAVVSIDKKNRLFSWNKGAEKIYGWSEEEAIGRELFEVVNPSNTTLSHEEFLQILRQTGSWSGEDFHHRRNGEEFPVLITASLIKDKNGNEIGAVTVFKDITERKNAEKDLVESRQRFYGAFHDSPSMNAIVHSRSGRIIEANKAMLQVTGFGPEVIGKNSVLELNAWLDIEQRDKLLAELSRKGRLSDIELKFRMKNGDIRAFNANISLINLNKEPYYFVSMIDITTRKEAEEALLASEKRYRTMLDNMMEGCQIIDFSWRYTYVNDASAKLTRVAKETLLGQKITDVYPGIEATGIYTACKKCMEQRVPVRMEYKNILTDGTYIWLDSSIQPVPEGIFVLSLDITERRKMEDSLRYHASLVENVSDAIVSSDENIKILTWNKAAEEMYGWREDEVIGKTVMEVTRSIPVNTAVTDIRSSLNKNNHWRGEALHERKNGEKINVMVSVSLIKDQNGKETGAVTIFKDITEEKKVEMAIHHSEERFRRIFQSGPLGIIFSTLNNRITMANDRFCELTGYSEEELRDMTLQDFFSTEDASGVKAKLAQLVRGDVSYFNIEGLCRIKSGQTAWGSLTITLIRNNEGKPQGFVTMVQDISARKRSEDRINHLNLCCALSVTSTS